MKHFYRLLILIAILVFSGSILHSQLRWYYQNEVEVGKQPVAVYEFETFFLVYCAGWDANFNGVKDEGDETPSLWGVGKTYLLWQRPEGNEITSVGKKFEDLDFETVFLPVRMAQDKKNKEIYLSSKGRIIRYLVDPAYHDYKITKIDDNVYPKAASGISLSDSKIFLSIRPNFTDPGYVLVLDRKTRKVLDTIPADVNVQQTIYDNGKLYILSEGTYSGNDATLRFVDVSGSKNKLDTMLIVGKGANHISLINEYTIAVTLNAESNLKTYFLHNYALRDSISIPANPLDGPRETISDSYSMQNHLYVTTYTSDVKVYNWAQRTLINTIKLEGKAEGMAIGESHCVIATPFIKDTYQPDSMVTYLMTEMGVEEDYLNTIVKIYPNPVKDNFNINIETDEFSEFSIISLDGRTILEPVKLYGLLEKISFSTKSLKMVSGQYFLKLRKGSGYYVKPFIVAD